MTTHTERHVPFWTPSQNRDLPRPPVRRRLAPITAPGVPHLSDSPRERRTGRNAPCPCGSGTKYKKCCGR